MASEKERICPRCGKAYVGKPALSRADGKTEICPDCGTEEALDAIGMGKEDKKGVMDAVAEVMAARRKGGNE